MIFKKNVFYALNKPAVELGMVKKLAKEMQANELNRLAKDTSQIEAARLAARNKNTHGANNIDRA